MFNRNKIGIIGLGFVGNAIKESVDHNYIFNSTVLIDPSKGFLGKYEDLVDADGVFVCVPSPQADDGTCDTGILESVLKNLEDVGFKGVIISKCTAPPLAYRALQNKYKNLVHSPEFLTAANAARDYANGKFSFIGGDVSAYRNEAERIIKLTQDLKDNVVHCTIEEASLAKYTINSFLATKVIFMNEIYSLSKKLGCDYDTVAKMVTMDTRIGTSHMKVPGLDGSLGFAGMCFPKDTSALIKLAEEVDIRMNVLDSAVKKNTLLRLTESK
jgi:UDPglucose 6-dehydrogenase